MLEQAEKSQLMAKKQLGKFLNEVPAEHKGLLNDLMSKVKRLENEHDPEYARKLQEEVNELIRKQRENAS